MRNKANTASELKLDSTAHVFQHLGQSWEKLQTHYIRTNRATLVLIFCTENTDAFTYRINNELYTVAPGHTEALLLEIDSCLEIITSRSNLALILTICAKVVTDLELNTLMPSVSMDRCIGQTAIHTKYTIQKLLASCHSFQASHRLLYNAQIFEILYHQMTSNIEQENHQLSIHYEKVKLAKAIIHEDLSKRITIPILAKIVGTNEQYLKKYFKVYSGKTIAGYTAEVKMEHARTLLASGKHLIVDVSRMLGYKHSTHFTTTFKKHFGFKPTLLK